MDAEEFARAPLTNNVVRCAACGRVHQWTKQDAELQDRGSDQGPDRNS
ncbi:MAG: hypothetical protein ACRET0_14970 [Steroidobacteraceae bacterium]